MTRAVTTYYYGGPLWDTGPALFAAHGRPPLVHTYPQWEPPEDEPWSDDLREVQRGVMRIVRNRRRVRLLKRRGVPMWQVCGVWCWFVDHPRLNAERDKRMAAYNSESLALED